MQPVPTALRRIRLRGRVSAAFGAVIVFALVLVASAGATPAFASSSKPAAAASNSGVLKWATDDPTEWDPVTANSGGIGQIFGLVYAPLIQLNKDGNATPGLATSWTYSDGGHVLTFQLRSGVTFTDGSKFTAAVAVGNIDRAIHEEGSTLASLLTAISKVQATGPLTVKLTLSQLNYGLPLVFGGLSGDMTSEAGLKNPKSLLLHPIGAGPFKLVSYTPGGSATLERNPKYWDAKVIHLSAVDLEFITDAQAVQAGLESGSLNFATIDSGTQVQGLRSAGIVVTTYPSLSNQTLLLNSALAPFKNNHTLVEAINYAINRKALIATQGDGYGSPSYQPFPPGYPGYSSAVANLYPYNPTKAKQLLAQAGYPNGITFQLTYVSQYQSLTEQLQSQLAAVGINTTLTEIPLEDAGEDIYLNHSVLAASLIYFGRESPIQTLEVQYGPQGLLNPGRSASAQLQTAIAKAASYPLGTSQFKSAMASATLIAAEQSDVVFLYSEPSLFAHTKNVTGLEQFVVAQDQRLDGVRVSS
jgi:peptide/nickel transport system substrate-binding protein